MISKQQGTLILSLLLGLGLLLVTGPAEASVLISYEHYVYAVGSDGIPIMDEANLPGETAYAASITKTGHPDAGNYGHVHYSASLATGKVQAYAFSQGVVATFWPYNFTATGRVERIYLQDALTFVVPPGTYPEGVTVTLHGTFKGVLWSEVGAGAQTLANVLFGSASFNVSLQPVGINEEGSVIYDEPIALSQVLVVPGGTLDETREYTKTFNASISGMTIWSVALNTGGGYVSGAAEGQFYDGDNGVSITDLEVPPGVQWYSESGVFLSHLVPAPQETPELAAPFLEPNYPNPFNPGTTVVLNLKQEGPVDLVVCDVRGRLVRKLVNHRVMSAGRHEVPWDGRDSQGRAVPAGAYLSRITADGRSETRSMIMVK